MIDIHTHILPGIDDGPKQAEEAVKMTEVQMAAGVSTAVCTPHFDPANTSLEEFVRNRTAALAQMEASKIKLIPASETMLHDYLFHYSDLEALCIENTRYLLLELPYSIKWEDRVYRSIEKLRNYYNIIPIIAHIERYPKVKCCGITQLRELGCSIQLNAQSVLDPGKRRKAMTYLKMGYIDVIASDCHDLLQRPPCIREAMELIRNKFGNEYYELFENNSRHIINGVELRKGKSYIIEK